MYITPFPFLLLFFFYENDSTRGLFLLFKTLKLFVVCELYSHLLYKSRMT